MVSRVNSLFESFQLSQRGAIARITKTLGNGVKAFEILTPYFVERSHFLMPSSAFGSVLKRTKAVKIQLQYLSFHRLMDKESNNILRKK